MAKNHSQQQSLDGGSHLMAAKFTSQWSMRENKSDEDYERHEAFIQFARETADRVAPWLCPLLDASDACVFASLGQFQFYLDQFPGQWFEIPEMAKLLTIEPWVAEYDVMH